MMMDRVSVLTVGKLFFVRLKVGAGVALALG
jgi:hypothetical protein